MSAVVAPASATPRNIQWLGMTPFLLTHLLVFGAIWSGVTWQAVVCAVVLYLVRMFAVTGGYHRYFSHRTYKTSRVFQFFLAFLAQTTSQKGALWWAAHHRNHHKSSDKVGDVHSPRLEGFWYSHCGWLYNHTERTDYSKVRDLARYPELVWLNELWVVPPVILAAACSLLFGWSGLFIGFFASTVVTWHSTFLINSLAHVVGTVRFATGDDSKNNWWLALITLGEGWHNNHHYAMGSTRQGFYWWEIDVTYYVLKGLEKLGLVWELREPPEEVLALGRRLDRARALGVDLTDLLPSTPTAQPSA
jgi:stearoyl-CoA desaturase (Delta-9 desaturase)